MDFVKGVRYAAVMTRTTAEPSAREIVDLVFLLVGRVQGHFEATAAEFGLPVTEAKALLRLGSGISMRELALELRCDASNVTGIADKLETRGLALREPHPEDRRVKRLALTPDGVRLKEDLSARLYEDVPIVAALAPDERRTFHDLLARAVSG
jgi:DNA-binding MarR family transcriptional regulator